MGQGESGSSIWHHIGEILTISVYINFVKHHVCEFLSRHRFVAPVDGSNGLEGKKDTEDGYGALHRSVYPSLTSG